MKKGLLPKIVAGLALAGILIGILGTALLYILSPKQVVNPDTSNSKEIKLSPEQLKQLKDITGSGSDNLGSGETVEISKDLLNMSGSEK